MGSRQQLDMHGKVKKKQLVDKVKLEVVGGSTAPNSNKKKQHVKKIGRWAHVGVRNRPIISTIKRKLPLLLRVASYKPQKACGTSTY
jgi:hypothetical protein